MRNEKEFGGLLVGGIQGKDEAHLWGNPFVRHQKAKLLETIVQEHKEVIFPTVLTQFQDKFFMLSFQYLKEVEAISNA